MSTVTDAELRHGIDRLAINGQRVFGWGWIAHRTRTAAAISLKIAGRGWERRLPVSFGLERRDVEEAFPDLANAGTSGFVVTGYIPDHETEKLTLEVSFDGGDELAIDITRVADSRYAQRRIVRMVAWLMHAVWRRLKRGD